MSYSTQLEALERTLIYLAEIQLTSCARTFGLSPCLAEGDQCYNTSATCKYKSAFLKATKVVKFCSSDVEGIPEGYRPYIKSLSFITTELQEDKTVPQMATLTLIDEPDSDIGMDPYWADRGSLDAPGTFFRKLFARYTNLKGRIITIKQGFQGLDLSEYKTLAVLKIADHSDRGGTVTIKAEDLLKSLDKYKYPFRIPSVAVAFDVPASFQVDSENGMLSLDAVRGDRCRRLDFGLISGLTLSGATGGDIAPGSSCYYQIFAYDAEGHPLAYASGEIQLGAGENAVNIQFNNYPGGNEFRIYGRTPGSKAYFKSYFGSGSTEEIIDNGGDFLYYTGDYPTCREFILMSDVPTDLKSWQQTITPETVTLTNTAGLDASGYLKIEKEIIYYSSFLMINGDAVLQNVQRALFETKGDRHYAGSAVYYILSYAPGNPFTILKSMLAKGGVSAYTHAAAYNALESAWTGIDFSCLPVAKDTDLGKLYMDLVNALDCQSWVNEDGLITIRMHGQEDNPVHITDEANIIKGSGGVDGGTKDVRTRLPFYWDKSDSTKAIDDKESYYRHTVAVDADAESENEYGEEIPKDIFTLWINSDCAPNDDLNSYVKSLLEKKLRRLRNPKAVYTFDVELKDSDVRLGQVVYIDSDDINAASGHNLTGNYQIIKREPKDNRITLSARYYPESAQAITLYVPDSPVLTRIFTKESAPDEIATIGLMYLAGTQYQGGSNLNAKLGKNEIKLRWANGYARTETAITDITGNNLEMEENTFHKSIVQYNVYMFTAYDNAIVKAPQYQRPTSNDSNGEWKVIARVPDQHITDENYLYTYTIKNLKVGKYYAFYVSESLRLHQLAVPEGEI